MITEPGLYDISLESYVADPCPEPSLSASIGWTLLTRSPRHAWAAHPRLNPARIEKQGLGVDRATVGNWVGNSTAAGEIPGPEVLPAQAVLDQIAAEISEAGGDAEKSLPPADLSDSVETS